MSLPYATDSSARRIAEEIVKEELKNYQPGGGSITSGVNDVFVDGHSVVTNHNAYITSPIKAYNALYEYRIDDLVVLDGLIFKSLKINNIGNNPFSATEWWAQYKSYDLIRHLDAVPETVDLHSDSFIEIEGEIYFKCQEIYKGRVRLSYRRLDENPDSELINNIKTNYEEIEGEDGNLRLGGTEFNSGINNIMLGTDVRSTGSNNVAIGVESQANADGTVAIGKSAVTNAINAIQLGAGTNNTANSLQIGSDNIYNASTHILNAQSVCQSGSPIWAPLINTNDPSSSSGQIGQLYLNTSGEKAFIKINDSWKEFNLTQPAPKYLHTVCFWEPGANLTYKVYLDLICDDPEEFTPETFRTAFNSYWTAHISSLTLKASGAVKVQRGDEFGFEWGPVQGIQKVDHNSFNIIYFRYYADTTSYTRMDSEMTSKNIFFADIILEDNVTRII